LSETGDELKNKYFQDAEELVQEASGILLDIEKQPNDENALNRLLRVVHTLKGSSSFIGFINISEYAHEIENVFGAARSGEITFDEDSVDVLYESFETLRNMIDKAKDYGDHESEDYREKIERLWDVVKKDGDTDSLVQGGGDGDGEPGNQISEKKEITPSKDIIITGKNWKFPLLAQEVELLRNLPAGQFFYVELQFDQSTSMVLSRAMATVRSLEESCDYIKSLPSVRYMEEEFKDKIELIIASDMNENDLKEILTINKGKVKTLEKLGLQKLDEDAMPSDTVETVGPQEYSKRMGDAKKEKVWHENTAAVKTKRGSEKRETTGRREADKVDRDERFRVKSHSSKESCQETIRISKDKLDTLMNLVGQMITNRTRSIDLLEEISNRYKDDVKVKSLKENFGEEGRIVSELQDSVMKSRMVPVALIFNKLPMIIRNLSRQAGKKVEGHIFGEATELDKNLVDRLWEPLVHMVRNSIDHGIETEEDRIAAGKSIPCRIDIYAYQEYNKIVIRVEDDGRGIDAEKLIEKAKENNMIDRAENEISEERLEDIIFQPGISTKDEVTSISGRGVGMDVVKKTIERLSGSVEISSVKGEGTTVVIRLPLTLAIIRSLLVRVGDKKFAVPIADVAELLKIENDRIRKNPRGTRVVKLRDEVLEVYTLRELLGMDGFEYMPERVNLAVVSCRQSKVGIMVDEFEREREIVIKNINGAYMNVEGISGATIMGDGSVVLILDIQILLKKMLKRPRKINSSEYSLSLTGN
jgi:two-component system chemotaxis sensor kinase CheA